MPEFSNNALILFARAPVKGQVKTRLYPAIDHGTIFQLYSCFLQDSIEKICTLKDVRIFIGVSSSDGMDYFKNLLSGENVKIFVQQGAGLGQRIEKAFTDRFAEGYKKTVIIGSDSPSLPTSYLKSAFGSDKDITLGPSTDGGYYLIGMANKTWDIFHSVDWGTEKVLNQTHTNIGRVGASLNLLPVWYDVDHIGDLYFLRAHLKLLKSVGEETPRATLDYLNQLGF